MNKDSSRTPFQEAVSVVFVVSVLVGLGCYISAINHVPFVSALLFTIGSQVYHRFPILNALRVTQGPMLVVAATIGTVFFIFGIPLAHWLAGVFIRSAVKRMERQKARLKKLQTQQKMRRRNDDNFKVA
jgi:MFS superfamily sulfate permease-like transporter